MKNLINTLAVILAPLALAAAQTANAAVFCTLTDYTILTYDHGGAYLQGKLDGTLTLYMILCGINSGGATDCSTPATDRNLAVVLTARSLHQALSVYFASASSCSAVPAYSRITMINLDP